MATAGDPGTLDLLEDRLDSSWLVDAGPSSAPHTADPSLGTVVLYRAGSERLAEAVAATADIGRREVLTPSLSDRLHFDHDDASRAMGWTTDGRAIVFHFVGDRCDLGDEAALQLVTTEGRPIVLGKAARLDLPRSINPRDIKEIIGAA